MADWDEDEFEPEAPGIAKEQLKGLWDDEDVEDEDVKESWEDEDDNAKKVSMKESAPDKNSESKPKKAGVVKKEKVPEAKISEAADDILSEKLRQQRLVEEADYKATTELFAKKGGEQSLDNFIPKSEHDFMEYAELLSHKIRSYEKSYHYIGLLKAVMRISMSSLKAADAKEISSSVAAIANEKLKAEKEANAGKKKQGAKKKQLHMDKPDDDLAASSFDDAADEFDFM